ncbi:hypothetical protein GCM10010885_03230 [Alicyclobacillus cellulosilyticus]|uniref:Inner membrane protein YgaP-like transmembrane domain-containing protein n=1 Tax=Alicyclobacillus cellulosilyticus TaxID=1003997 RepID=A0A917K172_9BACL|nr:DUF2892 domain-containing protein [Alicyclobacillus cellulosilyticus]GGI96997.1 hypothetical protein GCM10010885_03230 [Alicyclobacillus cellulosilyticus]
MQTQGQSGRSAGARNLGSLERYVRLAGGLLLFGAAQAMGRRAATARTALMTLGAMKIAEGILGWCPLVHAWTCAETAVASAGNRRPAAQAEGTQAAPVGQADEAVTNAENEAATNTGKDAASSRKVNFVRPERAGSRAARRTEPEARRAASDDPLHETAQGAHAANARNRREATSRATEDATVH